MATNVSRIDAQVTVLAEPNTNEVIRERYRELKSKWSKYKRWPEPKLILSPTGAQTLYSGSRSSDVFMRIYDKGLESGLDHFKGYLRYEIEFKRHRAREFVTRVLAESITAPAIVAECQSLFETRGCRLKWYGNVVRLYRRHRTRSNVEGRLEWLRVAVRGPIRDLIERGMLNEVETALGVTIVTSHGPTKSNEE